MQMKIILQHGNGKVEGIYHNSGSTSPLVIIINGHNGFYNYGMFPYLQRQLFEKGISSYSFNFSHGGITSDGDFFDDLEKYEKNCMRLEKEDLLCVLHNLNKQFENHPHVFLLAHSLGGVPTIFGANKALEEKINITGLLLVSTVKTLNFWPAEMIREWAHAGVYYKKNNRTKQDLPQGFEFLQEVINCDTDWNVQEEIQKIKVPILIVHGVNDEAIPPEHAESLYRWAKRGLAKATLKIIPGATHTYNTRHPFDGTSKQLEELIRSVVLWINQQGK